VFLSLSGTIATVSFVVLAALRPPAVAASKQSPEAIGPLLRDPRTRLGLVVLLLGGLVGGALALVVPVDLARFDVAVVVAFFTAAAIAQTVATPLIGRWADSRGPLVPVAAGAAAIIPSLMLLGMAGAGPTFVGAAFVAVVVAGAAFWAPGTVLTLGSRRDALPGLALAVGTVAWLGSYSAGTLAAGVVMDAGARAAAVWMLIVPAAGAWWLAVRGRWLPR
jgi:predicted MFS family arabinose efflux permease